MPKTKQAKLETKKVKLALELLNSPEKIAQAQAMLAQRAEELRLRAVRAGYKPKRGEKLKLFVWEGALTSYSSGVVFALAYNVAQAREVIIAKVGDSKDLRKDLAREPETCEKPEGFACHGGD